MMVRIVLQSIRSCVCSIAPLCIAVKWKLRIGTLLRFISVLYDAIADLTIVSRQEEP